MLQQTRVQAALPYYERFLARFPDINALANAPEEDVLACWSGLGYYSRARNLQRAARQLAPAGSFPRLYSEILSLPGIGEYTAAAIASIAFAEPHAVLDGNVMRVIARLENDASDISSARTRDRFRQAAQDLLDPGSPGEFNQAIMELGATVCLPRDPLCLLCPVASSCKARAAGVQGQLPVKLRKQEPERIEGILAVVIRQGQVLLWQRPATSARMASFWELPTPAELPGFRQREILGAIRHTITRHRFEFDVVSGAVARPPRGHRWFALDKLDAIPLSTTARKAIALLPRATAAP